MQRAAEFPDSNLQICHKTPKGHWGLELSWIWVVGFVCLMLTLAVPCSLKFVFHVGSTLYTIVQGFGEHQPIVLPSKLTQYLVCLSCTFSWSWKQMQSNVNCMLKWIACHIPHDSLLHVAKSLKLKTLWPKGMLKCCSPTLIRYTRTFSKILHRVWAPAEIALRMWSIQALWLLSTYTWHSSWEYKWKEVPLLNHVWKGLVFYWKAWSSKFVVIVHCNKE